MKKSLKYSTWLVITLFVLTSCSVVYKDYSRYAEVVSTQELGSIGLEKKDVILGKRFVGLARPVLYEKIEVKHTEVKFNKRTFNSYKKHLSKLDEEVNQKYVDSLPNKPTYFKVSITDLSVLTDILKAEKNKETQDYIMKNSKHEMIGAVTFVAPLDLANAIRSSNVVYLKQMGRGRMLLSVKNDTGETVDIDFAKLQIFDYELLQFCWGIDHRMEKELRMIIPKGSHCPAGAKRNIKQLQVEDKLYEF